MMTKWFNVKAEVMWRPEIAVLPNKQFRRLFLEALAGEHNVFSPYVRGPFDRPMAHEWKRLRCAVFERDDYTCRYCGVRGVRLECDHVHPVSRGGSSDMDNLVTACRPCNRSKRAKTVEEWTA